MRKRVRNLFLLVIIAAVVICGYEIKKAMTNIFLQYKNVRLNRQYRNFKLRSIIPHMMMSRKYIIKHLSQLRTDGFINIKALILSELQERYTMIFARGNCLRAAVQYRSSLQRICTFRRIILLNGKLPKYLWLLT